MTHDISGYQIFSAGELGEAHEMAHQMLDLGLNDVGYRRLGRWLEGRTGSGSQWVHLQWHLLVFELAVGRRDEAFARLQRHVLPAAATGDALTDAPAALWRLWLAGADTDALPWSVVRGAAVEHLDEVDDHYVTLHDLLALAGAGDLAAIDRWLTASAARTAKEHTLERFALGLRCFAAGDFAHSAAALAIALPGVADLGGSRAQNELFYDIFRVARSRSTITNNQQGENNGNHYVQQDR
jgi:hypothetical protein